MFIQPSFTMAEADGYGIYSLLSLARNDASSSQCLGRTVTKDVEGGGRGLF